MFPNRYDTNILNDHMKRLILDPPERTITNKIPSMGPRKVKVSEPRNNSTDTTGTVGTTGEARQSIISEQIQSLTDAEITAEKKKLIIFNLDPRLPIVDGHTGVVRDLKLEIPLSTEGLDVLSDAGHIFIIPGSDEFGGKFYDVGNKFDLMNDHNRRVFLAIETLETIAPNVDKCCGTKNVQHEYDIIVLGSDGGDVFNIVKKSEISIITYKNETLGYLTQKDGFGKKPPTKYVVSDGEGDLFYIIHTDEVREGGFNVCYASGDTTPVARIGDLWFDLEGGMENPFVHTYGVEFEEELHVEHKALLVAALFTGYFRFFKPDKGPWLCETLGIDY